MSDNDNLYAPPTSQAQVPVQQPFDGEYGRIDIGGAYRLGWAKTWETFPLWLGVLIVWGILLTLSYVTIVGIIFLIPTLVWGITRFLLNCVDGEPDFGDIFSGFQDYLGKLGPMLLLTVLYIVASLVGSSVQLVGGALDSQAITMLGVVLSLVWSFAVLIRFYFAPFFIVDLGYGAVQALQASWEATSGQWASVFGLMLMSIAVVSVGMMALCIGVIPASMITYIAFVAAYRQIVPRHTA